MSETISADPSPSGTTLPAAECEALLGRVCFGHLAFARDGHVNALPTRYAFQDGWVYFRADAFLREVIGHNRWLVLSVTELRDETQYASVIVRGACYPTEETGSAESDAVSLRGIMELRDRPTVGRERPVDARRSLRVFRLHADEIRGVTTFVPCPAGDRAYDELELQRLRDAGRDQTAAEDERADDDGMAEPAPPTP